MAPRWLPFGDESGNKRTSVLSVMSSNRKTTYEDPDALVNAFSHPFFDQNSIHDALENTERFSASDKASSKKRYSFFARSISTTDGDERAQQEPTRAWHRFPFQDRHAGPTEDDDNVNLEDLARKPSRKMTTMRSGKHEPILRWMRRVERSSSTRPSTPFGFYSKQAPNTEEDREQRKASISAPFNFQHVTHTQSRELPRLDVVSDRDLTLTFWASSAHQTPQADLRGIVAEDIEEVQKMSRPGSTFVESRPNSAGQSSAFGRTRSPSLPRDATSPILRASRSLSNASAQSNEDSRRPSVISRSASLASLIAEPRSPPTMVHPAFRAASESALQTPSMPWMQPSGPSTPQAELNRNLDVVPEEFEGQSPPKSAGFRKSGALGPIKTSFEDSVSSKPSHLSTSSSTCSDGQETSTMSQCDMSLPSLSSGETWEEDVDFCYNMEAESTCDFRWQGGKQPFASPSAHDSVLSAPRKLFSETSSPYDVSPRVSIAQHQRNKSSMTMTPLLASPDFESKWDPISAFERPRAAPGAPLPEINRLSSLLDLPMLRTPVSEVEAVSPGKASIHTVTDLRSSAVFRPAELTAALNHYSSRPQPDSPTTLLAPARIGHARGRSWDQSTSRSPTPDAKRLSGASIQQRPNTAPETQLPTDSTSRPVSHAGAPSPPPTIPLPPIPKDTKALDPSIAAKRATVAAAPRKQDTEEIIMRRPSTKEARSLLQAAGRKVQHSRTAMPPSSQRMPQNRSRSVVREEQEQPSSLRELMKRSKSSPSVHDLYRAHAVPKTAEKFPVWI